MEKKPWAILYKRDKNGERIKVYKCIECGSDEEKHKADGVCRECFGSYYAKVRKERKTKPVPLLTIDEIKCHFKGESIFHPRKNKIFTFDGKKYTIIKTIGKSFYAMLTYTLK